MVLRSTEECVKERLVEFIHGSHAREQESRRLWTEASYSLKSAKDFIEIGHLKYSIIAAYDSMEAAAKASLALRGIKPKMHKCVFLYLREEFVDKNVLEDSDVDALENTHTTRVQAHYVLGSKVSETAAKSAIVDAENFVEKMKSLIEKLR